MLQANFAVVGDYLNIVTNVLLGVVGVMVLGEELSLMRVSAAILIVSGLVMMKLAS